MSWKFSKKFASYSEWFAHRKSIGKAESAYTHRIAAAHRLNPEGSLKVLRGHKQEYAYRTTFVLKLPVKGRWKVVRRSITRLSPVDTQRELDSFLRHAGKVVKSQPYASENKALVGIEDNQEIPIDTETELGIDTDDYDEGAT